MGHLNERLCVWMCLLDEDSVSESGMIGFVRTYLYMCCCEKSLGQCGHCNNVDSSLLRFLGFFSAAENINSEGVNICGELCGDAAACVWKEWTFEYAGDSDWYISSGVVHCSDSDISKSLKVKSCISGGSTWISEL